MPIQHQLNKIAHKLLRTCGVQVQFLRPVRDPIRHFACKAAELGIQTVFDVGANAGQFASSLRQEGYKGPIISFEPLSAAHSNLCLAAKHDPLWHVAQRCALGDENQTQEIQVTANLASSSLLAVEQRSIDAAPELSVIGQETITVHKLDEMLKPEWQAPFAMKLDTQGYELHVLRGAPQTLRQTALIVIEMSLAPLYRGGPDAVEVQDYLKQHGYRCIGISQGFADHQRHEVLQVDGIFVKA